MLGKGHYSRRGHFPCWENAITTVEAISHAGKMRLQLSSHFPTLGQVRYNCKAIFPDSENAITTVEAVSHPGKMPGKVSSHFPSTPEELHEAMILPSLSRK